MENRKIEVYEITDPYRELIGVYDNIKALNEVIKIKREAEFQSNQTAKSGRELSDVWRNLKVSESRSVIYTSDGGTVSIAKTVGKYRFIN